MAKYKQTFYGSSYYGRLNAFSGDYQTLEVDTEEELRNNFTVRIQAKLPSVLCNALSTEIEKTGAWQVNSADKSISSSALGDSLFFATTGNKLTLFFDKKSTSPSVVDVNIRHIAYDGTETTTTHTFSANSSTIQKNASFVINNMTYGDKVVTLSVPSQQSLTFRGFETRCTNVGVETRTRVNGTSAWTVYERATVAITENDGYVLLSAESPPCIGHTRVQARLWLATGDSDVTPEVEIIEFIAGDSRNRTEDGVWEAVLDMQKIAQAKSKTFSEVSEVNFEDITPATTTMNIRTASSVDRISYSPLTVPYKNNRKRIRLKKGKTQGWITSPVLSPNSSAVTGIPKELVDIVTWDVFRDESYLPPDNAGSSIEYSFLTSRNETNVPASRIYNPKTTANRNIQHFPKQDLFLKTNLRRMNGKATPVVDLLEVDGKMYYEQDFVRNTEDITAVDEDNKGKKIYVEIKNLAFTYPRPYTNSDVTYQLIDKVNRPTELMLYFDSEKSTMERTHFSTNKRQGGGINDKIWAEVIRKVDNKGNGVHMHYQYSGGTVYYQEPNEIVMSNTFTPALFKGKKYRYYVSNGWTTEHYIVRKKDTIETVAKMYEMTVAEIVAINPNLQYGKDGYLLKDQKIEIPNKSFNEKVLINWKSNGKFITEKSSHNAYEDVVVDKANDTLLATITVEPPDDLLPWRSEEKIYDGFLNLNDIRSEYNRKQLVPTNPRDEEINWTVMTGETYKSIAAKYGIHEHDLRKANNAGTEELVLGQNIVIPTQISLPFINPEAVLAKNPFVIEIISGSVKKKDNTLLETELVKVKKVDITYKEIRVEREEVIRGAITNGKDLLRSAHVTKINSVKSENGIVVYNQWNETQKNGDFKVLGNYIDWSPLSNKEPAKNEKYIVSYSCLVPSAMAIQIDSEYEEVANKDILWRSPEVKEYTLICEPGKDAEMVLPNITEWAEVTNAIKDTDFVVEDDDIWVKTWIEKKPGKNILKASLGDYIPSENWYPLINTGFYYLAHESFYLYSEPVEVEPTEREFIYAENISYLKGKDKYAAFLEQGSKNLISNTIFESEEQIVFEIDFESKTSGHKKSVDIGV